MEIVTGLLLGLSTLLFVGPVFFYLIKTAAEHSKAAGAAVATGIIIGDIIYVILVVKGLGLFFADVENQKWLALAGGILFIGMGLKYIVKPNSKEKYSPEKLNGALLSFLTKGFLINFMNPFVVGVWILFLGINQSKFSDETAIIVSLTATLFTIFVTDLLKVFFAAKLKTFITPNKLILFQKGFGLLMILFGIRFLFEASKGF